MTEVICAHPAEQTYQKNGYRHCRLCGASCKEYMELPDDRVIGYLKEQEERHE